MISPDTTETISAISFTKSALAGGKMPKPSHSITLYFLKDPIPNLCLPVHTGKKVKKTKLKMFPFKKNLCLLSPLPLSATSHQYNPVLCKSLHICCSSALYRIHVMKAECETSTVTTCPASEVLHNFPQLCQALKKHYFHNPGNIHRLHP